MAPEDELDELGTTVLTDDSGAFETVVPGTLQLVVIGDGRFATHPVPDCETVTLGRSPRCEIIIDHWSISRRHALLRIAGDSITIEDLGSANGTKVRALKLEPRARAPISVGESVQIGSNFSIILQQRTRGVRTRRIWTHDYFETRLEEECKRVERSGLPFAVLRIDVERDVEEAVVEETLGDVVRESDILGKYGPFQYEVLTPDTPAERASMILRRIEGELRGRGLTCRISVACCPRDGRSPYQLSAFTPKQQTETRSDIVVKDSQMQSLYVLIEQVAASNISVLLLGETGVGKEVFARALHRASRRAAGPFVEINCGALTDTLLESELFGHEKGAFTNAQAAKPGLLETANRGTVFLDEIGEMPLNTQVKLLRVIEDSQLRRVGGVKARSIDVRFVAATNVDLEARVAAGTFRRDLFYRLNGVSIVIPALRERLSELEPMARAFIERAAGASDMRVAALTSDALALMKSYAWPGNVRELKNMIERAVLLSRGEAIALDHLPAEKMRATLVSHRPSRHVPSRPDSEPPTDTAAPLAKVARKGTVDEQRWIQQALERAGGNQTLAARLLGISRRTLVSRLGDYELDRPRKKRR